MLNREQMRKNWGYVVTQGNFAREQGAAIPSGRSSIFSAKF